MTPPSAHRSPQLLALVVCGCLLTEAGFVPAAQGAPWKALFVTGYDPHGHPWQDTTPILERLLAESKKFDVRIAKLTSAAEAHAFASDFAKCHVVVLYAHGLEWPKTTRDEFVKYMDGGGGLVVIHNAVGQFAGWDAYRAMIGIGTGDQHDGVRLAFDEARQRVVRVPPGDGIKCNGHGHLHEWVVKVREPEHPIMAGLPGAWKHTGDELYHGLRGKAEHIEDLKVLATAFSAKETGGTGEHEPVMLVNRFGKGRIFHATLGHNTVSMSCAGFQTLFLRGMEWAATGKVAPSEVPADFPTEAKASVRPAARKAYVRKIVFIGGRHNHGPGAHENNAGTALLKSLIDSSDNVRSVATALYPDRPPDDLAQLDEASALVVLCEGWNEHWLNHRNLEVMKKFRQIMQKGTGLVCLHAATAVEDDVEKEFMTWCGGNKKQGYSTHPMTDDLELLVAAPGHPISRDVKPMRFDREEFYRRILFDESAGKITPILTVGSKTEKPAEQVVAWAFERPGGGRAFCCTGPHFYASFKNDNFRKLILNAVLWAARHEVPQDGVRGSTPMESLFQDLASPRPATRKTP
ncbi:MAG: ThuA domain-containing protein [Planctomycetota bacterium]